ncbi:unnamed protein product [Dibothriocephalus latus]|uniref:Uncharacterized protein n=1 Tax=Dibothriocephalus latus TaxID=60516 RepID=A0A3P7PLI7_DIBLA|nr:unnamed protein product [Dibothriocephalus latus]
MRPHLRVPRATESEFIYPDLGTLIGNLAICGDEHVFMTQKRSNFLCEEKPHRFGLAFYPILTRDMVVRLLQADQAYLSEVVVYDPANQLGLVDDAEYSHRR